MVLVNAVNAVVTKYELNRAIISTALAKINCYQLKKWQTKDLNDAKKLLIALILK